MHPSDTGTFRTLSKHEVYFINGGDLYILAQDVHFRVHRYFFERESPFFHKWLIGPASPGASRPGSTESTALVIEEPSEEFAKFLWVFYNPKYSLYNTTVGDWKTILRLAHKWDFGEVKALVVRELEKLIMSDVDRISTYHRYDIDRTLLMPRYAAICGREQPLTLHEGRDLGLETTLMIAQAREVSRTNPSSSGLRSPSVAGLQQDEMFSLIRNIFGLAVLDGGGEETEGNTEGGVNGNGTAAPPGGLPLMPSQQGGINPKPMGTQTSSHKGTTTPTPIPTAPTTTPKAPTGTTAPWAPTTTTTPIVPTAPPPPMDKPPTETPAQTKPGQQQKKPPVGQQQQPKKGNKNQSQQQQATKGQGAKPWSASPTISTGPPVPPLVPPAPPTNQKAEKAEDATESEPSQPDLPALPLAGGGGGAVANANANANDKVLEATYGNPVFQVGGLLVDASGVNKGALVDVEVMDESGVGVGVMGSSGEMVGNSNGSSKVEELAIKTEGLGLLDGSVAGQGTGTASEPGKKVDETQADGVVPLIS